MHSLHRGVYKLQKVKYRQVQKELDKMKSLMQPSGASGSGSTTSPSRRASTATTSSPGDILQPKIPELRGEFSKLSAPGMPALYAAAGAEADTAAAAAYKELVVRKLRAEGVQKGSNMVTDAWTFANMKMMTMFMRSCFVSAKNNNPGYEELKWIWIYTSSLFVVCLVLVAAAWECQLPSNLPLLVIGRPFF